MRNKYLNALNKNELNILEDLVNNLFWLHGRFEPKQEEMVFKGKMRAVIVNPETGVTKRAERRSLLSGVTEHVVRSYYPKKKKSGVDDGPQGYSGGFTVINVRVFLQSLFVGNEMFPEPWEYDRRKHVLHKFLSSSPVSSIVFTHLRDVGVFRVSDPLVKIVSEYVGPDFDEKKSDGALVCG
jgi:hypothetical protein